MIVESPAKARKISGYLGDEFIVEASVGHIRDLPQRAADIPKEVKKFAWSKEGVDIENDFAPLYVINPDKKAKVSELKALMKEADKLMSYPAVQKAYEHFIFVAKLTKENNE